MRNFLLRGMLMMLCASCCVARVRDDTVYFVSSKIEQTDNGFIVFSCDFSMYGRHIDYVVITGTNKISEYQHAVGYPDSGAVQVFVGGKWRDVPDERFCGTGMGMTHFVPVIYQTIQFGIAEHTKLRQFLSRFGDPEAAYFSVGCFQ